MVVRMGEPCAGIGRSPYVKDKDDEVPSLYHRVALLTQ